MRFDRFESSVRLITLKQGRQLLIVEVNHLLIDPTQSQQILVVADYDLLVFGFANIQLEHMADAISLPEGVHRILSALKSTSSVSDAEDSLSIDELIEERRVVSLPLVNESREVK